MNFGKILSENIIFKILKLITTVASFLYLYHYFSDAYIREAINIKFGAQGLIFISLFVFSNILLSIAWSKNIRKIFDLDEVDSFLVSMRSYIGKYAAIKIGSYVIKYSQDFKLFDKKKFLKLAFFEQLVSLIVGLTFGIFFLFKDVENNFLPLVIIFLINFLLFFAFKYSVSKKNNLFSKIVNNSAIYMLNSFYLFFIIAEYIKTYNFNKYLLISAIYIFVSSLSMIVSIIPAGLGVKEAGLIFLLTGIIQEEELINLLIELRIFFIISDILSYLLGMLKKLEKR